MLSLSLSSIQLSGSNIFYELIYFNFEILRFYSKDSVFFHGGPGNGKQPVVGQEVCKLPNIMYLYYTAIFILKLV